MRIAARSGAVVAAAISVVLAGCETLRPAPPPSVSAPAVAAPAPVAELPPAPVAVRARAPERASCVPRAFPRAPKYPDTDQALRDAGGAADRYQLLAAGRLARARRLAELERTVDACR